VRRRESSPDDTDLRLWPVPGPLLRLRFVNIGDSFAQIEAGVAFAVDSLQTDQGSVGILIPETSSKTEENAFDIKLCLLSPVFIFDFFSFFKPFPFVLFTLFWSSAVKTSVDGHSFLIFYFQTYLLSFPSIIYLLLLLFLTSIPFQSQIIFSFLSRSFFLYNNSSLVDCFVLFNPFLLFLYHFIATF